MFFNQINQFIKKNQHLHYLRKIHSCSSKMENFTPNPSDLYQYWPITIMNDWYWQLITLIGTTSKTAVLMQLKIWVHLTCTLHQRKKVGRTSAKS